MSILGGYRQLQRRSWEASMSRVEGKYPRHGRLLLVVSLDRRGKDKPSCQGSYCLGRGRQHRYRVVSASVGEKLEYLCDYILTLPSFLGQFQYPECSVLMVSVISM